MNEPRTSSRQRPRVWLLALFAVTVLVAIPLFVRLAARQHSDPLRCPPGSQALGARCCGLGQHLVASHCAGEPNACPAHLTLTHHGCVLSNSKVRFSGGTIRLASVDWEGRHLPDTGTARVGPFALDVGEVVYQRYEVCVQAGACKKLHAAAEPGLPVTRIVPEAAERFCRFSGGRLPSVTEWLLAASGGEPMRRYPWGQTGLVCRRAVFGLVRGPCAFGAVGPELAGLRPDGATPEGVYDLAGNVAELTKKAEGGHAVHGGSFRSTLSADLKSLSFHDFRAAGDHIGFRCAYDL